MISQEWKRQAIDRAAELKGKWFILYTRNGCEAKLQKKSMVLTVVPMMQVVTDDDPPRTKTVPKYSNYVYMQHDGSPDFFEKCLLLDGASYWVGGNKNLPFPVPEPDIEQIVMTEQRKNLLRQGMSVRVVDGPLKNFVGKIAKKNTDGSFAVEISIFDRAVIENMEEQYIIGIEK